jgi:hypothetical protein
MLNTWSAYGSVVTPSRTFPCEVLYSKPHTYIIGLCNSRSGVLLRQWKSAYAYIFGIICANTLLLFTHWITSQSPTLTLQFVLGNFNVLDETVGPARLSKAKDDCTLLSADSVVSCIVHNSYPARSSILIVRMGPDRLHVRACRFPRLMWTSRLTRDVAVFNWIYNSRCPNAGAAFRAVF